MPSFGATAAKGTARTEVGDLDRMWRLAAQAKALPAVAKGPKGLTGNLLAHLAAWGEQLNQRPKAEPSLRPGSFTAHLRHLAAAG